MSDALLDPTSALAQLAKINLRTQGIGAVLSTVSALAKRAIPGAAEASVSLLRDGTATTPAATGELASRLDESQYVLGHGPCLDAAQGGEHVVIDDMRTDDRWPDYAVRALEQGVHSSLSVPLPVQDTVTGALNIYALAPGTFDQRAVELARSFAGVGAIAVANAYAFEAAVETVAQLEAAMASRAVIEQAKGFIMGQRRCTAQEAFDVLVRASSHRNRKLRDIAAELVAVADRGPAT